MTPDLSAPQILWQQLQGETKPQTSSSRHNERGRKIAPRCYCKRRNVLLKLLKHQRRRSYQLSDQKEAIIRWPFASRRPSHKNHRLSQRTKTLDSTPKASTDQSSGEPPGANTEQIM